METKIKVYDLDGELVFSAYEIYDLISENWGKDYIRLINGLISIGVIKDAWFYYDKLDRKKMACARTVGKKALAAYDGLVSILMGVVEKQYTQRKILESQENKCKEDVIRMSNILFANSGLFNYFHDKPQTDLSYTQYVITMAEEIVITQNKYRKEGKL